MSVQPEFSADIINPFLSAMINVFKQLFSVELRKGKLGLKENPYPGFDVAIVVKVTGEYKGVVVYSMKYDTGWKMIYKLFPNKPPKEAKAEYKDIIGEVANMITGNAMTLLAKKGKEVHLSVPEVIEDVTREKSPVFSLKIPTLFINFYSPYGTIEANVALLKT